MHNYNLLCNCFLLSNSGETFHPTFKTFNLLKNILLLIKQFNLLTNFNHAYLLFSLSLKLNQLLTYPLSWCLEGMTKVICCLVQSINVPMPVFIHFIKDCLTNILLSKLGISYLFILSGWSDLKFGPKWNTNLVSELPSWQKMPQNWDNEKHGKVCYTI